VVGVFEKLFGSDARSARAALVQSVERELGHVRPFYAAALVDVPRECFVRPGDEGRAAEDIPLPLDDTGRATISAPHAYVLSFDLAELAPGDTLLELGAGTGYGAALAAHIVGETGRVTTIEIDPSLAARARTLLANYANVTLLEGDALHMPGAWAGMQKAICTFSIARIPQEWMEAIPNGGVLVAPVGPPNRTQNLVRARRTNDELVTTVHGTVRYVPSRSS